MSRITAFGVRRGSSEEAKALEKEQRTIETVRYVFHFLHRVRHISMLPLAIHVRIIRGTDADEDEGVTKSCLKMRSIHIL